MIGRLVSAHVLTGYRFYPSEFGDLNPTAPYVALTSPYVDTYVLTVGACTAVLIGLLTI